MEICQSVDRRLIFDVSAHFSGGIFAGISEN